MVGQGRARWHLRHGYPCFRWPAVYAVAADGLSIDQLAVVECLAIGAHAVRRTTLLGSRNAAREDFEQVVQYMRDRRVSVDAMITHRGKLEQLPELMPLWSQPGSGVIKALVEVS